MAWLQSQQSRLQEAFDKQQQAIIDRMANIDAMNKAALLKNANATITPLPDEYTAYTQSLTNTKISQSSLIPFDMTKILTWIKSNVLLSVGIAAAIIFMFFPKMFSGLLGSTTRRRHYRRSLSVSNPAPRRNRTVRRNRPSIRRTKGAKKPWQIKGSRAARLRMARIRRMR